MIGTCQDVTELKQVEDELKKLNEELEIRVAKRTEELEESRSELEMQNEELRETCQELEVETAARIRAMENLREKEQLLLQQSRMAAMGEMLGYIAHQWRQPLNVLGLTIQQLGLSYELGGFNKELLDDSIGKSMEIILHLSQTIDDFWNFSIPDREKCQFSLDQVIAKAVSLIEDSFKELRIIIDSDTIGAPRINGYPNEFAQVLLKILMNSKDALLEQGTIDARVTVRSWTEDGRAVVTIADNGGGIREEIIGKIFDPYFTTKELGKGIGVGLFMAKIIIEKNMGGSLTVRNISGGAEFRIEV
jgi:C4-dicarboxylate-specific signal transduction histidine kinase